MDGNTRLFGTIRDAPKTKQNGTARTRSSSWNEDGLREDEPPLGGPKTRVRYAPHDQFSPPSQPTMKASETLSRDVPIFDSQTASSWHFIICDQEKKKERGRTKTIFRSFLICAEEEEEEGKNPPSNPRSPNPWRCIVGQPWSVSRYVCQQSFFSRIF